MSIQKVNCWPIDNQAWMDKTVERQCLYKVDINPGEFFGEIEICNKTCRMEKILASQASCVLFINATTFMNILSNFDKSYLYAKIERWEQTKKQIPETLKHNAKLQKIKAESIKEALADQFSNIGYN